MALCDVSTLPSLSLLAHSYRVWTLLPRAFVLLSVCHR